MTTEEKMNKYLEAYPGYDEIREVLGGALQVTDEELWDLAYQALQEGKVLRWKDVEGKEDIFDPYLEPVFMDPPKKG